MRTIHAGLAMRPESLKNAWGAAGREARRRRWTLLGGAASPLPDVSPLGRRYYAPPDESGSLFSMLSFPRLRLTSSGFLLRILVPRPVRNQPLAPCGVPLSIAAAGSSEPEPRRAQPRTPSTCVRRCRARLLDRALVGGCSRSCLEGGATIRLAGSRLALSSAEPSSAGPSAPKSPS